MKRFHFFIPFLLCLFSLSSFAQRIDTTLAAYANKYQPERMYIQFDKPAYAPGETIWFKAYLMAGVMPTDISKNCYADFYDAGGKLIAHSLFPIVQGGAAGSFVIPDTLSSLAVHVKAYTTSTLR